MTTLLFSSKGDNPELWRSRLAKHIPDLDFRIWPTDIGDKEEIEFALAWRPKLGELRNYPNLKAIFSLGAGVDHLMRDPNLPEGIPVVRLVDPDLTRGMTEYVTHWVMHYHRGFHVYQARQAENKWKQNRYPLPSERSVGILGLGVLGSDAANSLVGLGFDVAGWSRSEKNIEGAKCYFGQDGLVPFLERTEILICLLPLTPETEGIINAETLAHLPDGAFAINAARGAHIVDDDLLAALGSGKVAAATLDVFSPEPLAEDHPYWSHPNVTVTPHIASLTNATTAAGEIAANIKRIQAGDPPLHIVDVKGGY
ncbi:MAG: glyoxylate/hydroxypyruvate reductase A [Rhodospirillaceae bacterium]|jgi:glyoxylate/hydroxypyruvate reductase|nr:glyoxylate/hydroxypyruvate reductase A [Rhodospirillales bacterium]MBT3905442.1 glyoxylate/hydroxypyruvate reductase A [Rhodospirillaceae bacterium]MBT4703511.1 glyoxylate/hydroxypyruvate reductase A [Rhodospirillaceae bacterium]MBT5034640.1 glyoxylate/hydroxypyruvate reductase A [Rhodospirillaceae bacterium]MBT6220484.1 glyoxylate/hydroxypyruvate reductase A [Rhodospirillaceae bacterium]